MHLVVCLLPFLEQFVPFPCAQPSVSSLFCCLSIMSLHCELLPVPGSVPGPWATPMQCVKEELGESLREEDTFEAQGSSPNHLHLSSDLTGRFLFSLLLRVVPRLLLKTTRGNSFVYNDATSPLLVPGGNGISIHPKHPPPFSICGSSS